MANENKAAVLNKNIVIHLHINRYSVPNNLSPASPNPGNI